MPFPSDNNLFLIEPIRINCLVHYIALHISIEIQIEKADTNASERFFIRSALNWSFFIPIIDIYWILVVRQCQHEKQIKFILWTHCIIQFRKLIAYNNNKKKNCTIALCCNIYCFRLFENLLTCVIYISTYIDIRYIDTYSI